jgi:hypothetical protein
MINAHLIRKTAQLLLMAFYGLGIGPYLQAQNPSFREWNVGLQMGPQPITGYTILPVLELDYKKWSLELSPAPMVAGAGITYHMQGKRESPPKVLYTADISLYASKENGAYAMLFPGGPRDLHDLIRTGLMVGPHLYFKERFSIRGMLGFSLLKQYGDKELGYFVAPTLTLNTSASLSLHVRLFKTFQQ